MELSVIPITLAEFSPPKYRGSIVGLYWMGVKLGGLVISGITRKTSTIHSNSAWQIPFSLFFVVPMIVAVGIWFIPETPRWLISKGCKNKAIESLQRIRPKSTPNEDIMAEAEELQAYFEEQPKDNSFLHIFRKVSRGRTAIVVLSNFFQQATGQSFASQYSTLFVKSLKTIDPFDYNLGNQAASVGGLLFYFVMTDTIGRRPVILLAATLQTACLLTMGGLGTVIDPSAAIKLGIIAMVIVFSISYSAGWATVPYLLCTEIPLTADKENTMRLGYTVKLVAEFVVSFTYPYLEDKRYAGLGSRVGFVYGFIAIAGVIWAYFFIPETRGMTLEEIEKEH